MKLTDVTLSYPFIRYSIDVTHFTSRRSTAIEWLILESVQRTQMIPEYQGMSIEDFFSALFGITDTNQMIRPCLLNLRDMGALQLDSIYDQTDMTQTHMGQLLLTPVGAAMQRDGKLPGADSTDRVRFCYNINENQLLGDSKSVFYQEKPNGIPARKMESAEEIAFPAPLISEVLEALKSQKDRPSWLMEETVFRHVIPNESELLWKNVLKALNVGKGMQCWIDGIQNTDVIATALEALNLNESDTTIPVINVNDPDEEFTALVPPFELRTLIEKMDIRDNLIISDIHICPDGVRTIAIGKANVNVRILCNAVETTVKIERGKISVFTSESLLPKGLVYLDRTHAAGIGSFSLNAGSFSRFAELAYIPKEIQYDPKEIAVNFIESIYHTHPGVLHIFRALGMQTEESRFIEQHINSLLSIEEKISCLVQLNEESVMLFKAKCVSEQKLNELIFDAESISSEITDIHSAQRVLERYTSIEQLKNGVGSMEALFRIILPSIKETKKLSDVHAFWNQIQSVGKQYIKFVKKEELYKSLYSDSVLDELISKYQDDDLYELEAYTPFESVLRDMKNLAERTQEILGLSLFAEISEAGLTEAVLTHRSELKSLIDFLERWRNLLDVFASHIGVFEEEAATCFALIQTDKNFQKLASVLSRFCCDKSLRYSKICILDTNSLMNMPELLSMLDGKDTMVIIPQMMLTELDGLKKDENEDKAYQAREAIRQIDNYSTFDWLNLKEQSNTDLLSGDLDPSSQDCRIISIALKYIIHTPILITDDVNMRNIAKSQGITAVTTEDFAANMQQLEREQEQSRNKNKDKKNKKKHKR